MLKKDGCDYFAFHDVDMLPYDDCYYGHRVIHQNILQLGYHNGVILYEITNTLVE